MTASKRMERRRHPAIFLKITMPTTMATMMSM